MGWAAGGPPAATAPSQVRSQSRFKFVTRRMLSGRVGSSASGNLKALEHEQLQVEWPP